MWPQTHNGEAHLSVAKPSEHRGPSEYGLALTEPFLLFLCRSCSFPLTITNSFSARDRCLSFPSVLFFPNSTFLFLPTMFVATEILCHHSQIDFHQENNKQCWGDTGRGRARISRGDVKQGSHCGNQYSRASERSH